MTTRCHSVFSLRSPDDLSRQVSEVASGQVRDAIAALHAADFRVLAQIAHQNDLVDASRHRSRLP